MGKQLSPSLPTIGTITKSLNCVRCISFVNEANREQWVARLINRVHYIFDRRLICPDPGEEMLCVFCSECVFEECSNFYTRRMGLPFGMPLLWKKSVASVFKSCHVVADLDGAFTSWSHCLDRQWWKPTNNTQLI